MGRFDKNFGPRYGDLNNANKGGDNLMEKALERRGFRPTILPKGGGIKLQIWSNTFLFPLFACMEEVC